MYVYSTVVCKRALLQSQLHVSIMSRAWAVVTAPHCLLKYGRLMDAERLG